MGGRVCTTFQQASQLFLDDAVQPVPSECRESNELDAKPVPARPTDFAQFNKQ
jgi:hypothetical protein